MRVLVVGGAGYIGSHMVKALYRGGDEVVTLDNLSTGWKDAVRYGELLVGDAFNGQFLRKLFDSRRFDAVMHFASFIEVGESVENPAKYYRNNFSATQTLLDAMLECGVNCFIFSSSAAVYGEPLRSPIDEDHPKGPINPYGRSKLMVEQLLEDYGRAYGLRHASLRYFNAAGADPDGELGERHQPESHLIPLVLRAASGRTSSIKLYGEDYDTPDGTCIRDYIHVTDLCSAHLLALKHLVDRGKSGAFNLGNGNGFSVREVIDSARRVTGREIRVEVGPRRQGDPARLVADSSRIRSELGWNPRYDRLDVIIEHAWNWETGHARSGNHSV